MRVMERTTNRRSLGSNALAFDEPQPAPYTSGPSLIPPQMIPFHCFCPISRVSLTRRNLRLLCQANGQAS